MTTRCQKVENSLEREFDKIILTKRFRSDVIDAKHHIKNIIPSPSNELFGFACDHSASINFKSQYPQTSPINHQIKYFELVYGRYIISSIRRIATNLM